MTQQSVSWLPAKEDKGDAVLTTHFLVKRISTAEQVLQLYLKLSVCIYM